jgi:hypothetical protein
MFNYPSVNSKALLLPSILPDMAWLEAFLRADEILILDNQLFSRKSRVHRGKIRTPESTQWIHIPIHNNDKKLRLRDCRIDNNQNWFTPLWRSIEFNYRNSIYFDFYEAEIKNDLLELRQIDLFIDGYAFFVNKLFDYLEIDGITGQNRTLTHKSTSVTTLDKDFTLAGLFQDGTSKSNTGSLIMEYDSKNYLNQAVPSDTFYRLPEYRQHFGGFEPNCCLIDLLFEMGPNTWAVLDTLFDS